MSTMLGWRKQLLCALTLPAKPLKRWLPADLALNLFIVRGEPVTSGFLGSLPDELEYTGFLGLELGQPLRRAIYS